MAKAKAKEKTVQESKTLDHASALVKRVWAFCNVLRDDGVGSSEYLEQLTFLLFLKMADEQGLDMPPEWNWKKLREKTGSDLKKFYEQLLAELGEKPGMLGQMFYQAKNHINSPARLSDIINMIDREVWSGLATDLKGTIYEELLERTASDKKSGAGQYFTARALISIIMMCIRPKPGETFRDPATGTGGFFLKAHEFILDTFGDKMDPEQKRFLRYKTFSGNEIVPTTRRLCLMNMYLHNMGKLDGDVPVELADALVRQPDVLVDVVATNPPFGVKTAQTVINDDGEESKEKQIYNRTDFWCTTSNKQLNFLQHIHSLLKPTGRAAVVLPDNVLFEKGAGETIRRKLMETCDLHTILRLPTGIFYAQGVRANVLFFDARPAAKTAQTKEVWVYDYRTNIHHTLKSNPMKESDLLDFVKCYNPECRTRRKETWDAEKNPEGRWRKFSYEEILRRPNTNLDFKWLKDEELTVADYSLESVRDALKYGANKILKFQESFDRSTKGVIDDSTEADQELLTRPFDELVRMAMAKILDLAIRGRLTKRERGDDSALEILEKIAVDKARRVAKKLTRKEKTLPPIEPDDEPFDIPKGWIWCRFGELCAYGQCESVSFAGLPKNTWALDLEEIEKDTGRLIERKLVKDKQATSGKHLFKKGMLLYSKLRTYLNKVLIADQDGVCTSEIIPIDFHGFVDAAYARIVLMSPYFLSYTASKDYGVKMPRVSTDDMRMAAFPLPPLAEQKRIVERVDAILAECRKVSR